MKSEEIGGIFHAGCSCEKKCFAKLRFEVVLLQVTVRRVKSRRK